MPARCIVSSMLLGVAVLGCSPEAGRLGADRRPSAGPDSDFPLTVTDSLERKVTLQRRPQRIVSLTPRNTELLFAVGAGRKVVGVTDYCNYPPEARKRPKVGGFAGGALSIERIVSLRPDLVLSVDDIHAPVVARLEQLGIPVLALEAESLAGLYDHIRLLGRIAGRSDDAGRLVEGLQKRVASVQKRVEDVPPAERVSVYYQIWDDPLTAAGPACFVGEMIELCGGTNVIADPSARYPVISEEALLKRNPEVILIPSTHSAPTDAEELMKRPGWKRISAVEHGRVHVIDGDIVSRCGPRIVDALEVMAALLYPDRFASADEPKGDGAFSARDPEAATLNRGKP